jgi:hypothetical protein
MSPHASPPMLTPHDDTRLAWQQACTQAAETLRPQHEHERLATALALAHDGAIRLEDDGAALVTSGDARARARERDLSLPGHPPPGRPVHAYARRADPPAGDGVSGAPCQRGTARTGPAASLARRHPPGAAAQRRPLGPCSGSRATALRALGRCQ